MEKNILVAKINKNDEISLKEFYEFLRQENIEYEEKLEEKWEGIKQPQYIAYINFYVNKKDELKVKNFIKDLENAIIQNEEHEELKGYKEEIHNEELKKYKKRQKKLQKIMVYGIFSIIVICFIITVIANLNN